MSSEDGLPWNTSFEESNLSHEGALLTVYAKDAFLEEAKVFLENDHEYSVSVLAIRGS